MYTWWGRRRLPTGRLCAGAGVASHSLLAAGLPRAARGGRYLGAGLTRAAGGGRHLAAGEFPAAACPHIQCLQDLGEPDGAAVKSEVLYAALEGRSRRPDPLLDGPCLLLEQDPANKHPAPDENELRLYGIALNRQCHKIFLLNLEGYSLLNVALVRFFVLCFSMFRAWIRIHFRSSLLHWQNLFGFAQFRNPDPRV